MTERAMTDRTQQERSAQSAQPVARARESCLALAARLQPPAGAGFTLPDRFAIDRALARWIRQRYGHHVRISGE